MTGLPVGQHRFDEFILAAQQVETRPVTPCVWCSRIRVTPCSLQPMQKHDGVCLFGNLTRLRDFAGDPRRDH